MLDELDQMWVPVERSWRLNDRHYGANKADSGCDKLAVTIVRQQKGGD